MHAAVFFYILRVAQQISVGSLVEDTSFPLPNLLGFELPIAAARAPIIILEALVREVVVESGFVGQEFLQSIARTTTHVNAARVVLPPKFVAPM